MIPDISAFDNSILSNFNRGCCRLVSLGTSSFDTTRYTTHGNEYCLRSVRYFASCTAAAVEILR